MDLLSERRLESLPGEADRVLPDGGDVEPTTPDPIDRLGEGGVRGVCHEHTGAAVDDRFAGTPLCQRDDRAPARLCLDRNDSSVLAPGAMQNRPRR